MQGKHYGYTDEALARISGGSIPYHQDCVYKMVDTCGANSLQRRPTSIPPMTPTARPAACPKAASKRSLYLAPAPSALGRALSLITAPCTVCGR